MVGKAMSFSSISTVRASGASRVGVTHGSSEVLARYLGEKLEVETFVVPTRYVGESPPTSASPTDASADEGVPDREREE